jgi:hypothetical protein
MTGATVAALRDTSIRFGPAIAGLALRQPIGPRRRRADRARRRQPAAGVSATIETGFAAPPAEARLRAPAGAGGEDPIVTRLAITLAVALAPIAIPAQEAPQANGFEDCVADVDVDAVAAKIDAIIEAEGVYERVEALCAAGDVEGAIDVARGVYDGDDPDIAAFRACLETYGLFDETVEVDGDDACAGADG